ncbi:serine protease [Arthrobotrys conoides]|uniref:Serine protease n=1 Tax=Arthrobotrys conoides TaxID=74498 RepID=A0AAN8RIZ4_9PEZI
MKTIHIISVGTIFAVIKQGCCTPLDRNSMGETRPDGADIKPANIKEDAPRPESSDAYLSYLVLFKDSETRSWKTILADMGFGTEIKENRPSKREPLPSRVLDQGDSRYFATSKGRHMHVFGGEDGTMRVLTMNMTQPEIERVRLLEYVELVEQNKENTVIGFLPDEVPELKPSPKIIRPLFGSSFGSAPLHCRSRGFDGKDLPIIEQCGAPWGLHRISSLVAPFPVASLSGQTALAYTYRFHEGAGIGVDIYVMDTIVDDKNVEFEGRAKLLWARSDAREGSSASWHGTHVAGTAGSRTYGVAKGPRIYGVAVIGINNSKAEYIYASGNAILRQHRKRQKDSDFAGSVVNISLNTKGDWPSMEFILRRFIEEGVHVAVAAGNDNIDACGTSPAGLSSKLPIISVGATTFDDHRISFSNWGPCVDIYAPGSNIVSVSTISSSVGRTMSGTSMSSPHVAGMMAAELTFLPEFKLDPKGLKRHILGKGIKNGVKLKHSKEDEKVVGDRLLLNNFSPSRAPPKDFARVFLPANGF